VTVLHVVDTLGTGGAEQQLAAFLRRSDPQRFGHAVCVLTAGGRFQHDLLRERIPVYSLGHRARGRAAAWAVQLRRLVQALHPDVLHATLFWPGVIARLVGRWSRIPVITSLVNTTYEPEWRWDNPRLTPWKVWAVRALDRATARLEGTWYVAITESVKASAVRQLGIPPERIAVIPRGLAPEEWAGQGDRARIRQALGWGDAYPVILTVGRLVPQKGQQYAIRAMPAVVGRFPTARLVIVGEGRLRRALEDQARGLGMAGHVCLLGERDDVGRLLQAADIFVFPSLFEGLGNAVLEAMASGRPCVCSDIPPLREVTDGGRVAVLVEPRSPAGLAAALTRLAEDPAGAQALGRQAQAWVRARYDIRRVVASLEAFYQRVVDQRRAPPTSRGGAHGA
jgi:glycosyltransferase involved in cell wall biosynthesis